MFSSGATGRSLPIEFTIFGITKENFVWHPIDSLAILKFFCFSLSWNWQNDMTSEMFKQKHPDLAALVEDLSPFTSEFMNDIITTVDDDDLKEWGQYSDEDILERYHAARAHAKAAEPPIGGVKEQKGKERAAQESDLDADIPFVGE